MAISRLSTSRVGAGLPKYQRMWDQSTLPFGFHSISTVTVGSGGASNVEFTSIPTGFTHLQIRGIHRQTSGGYDQLYAQINSDTGSNYSKHLLYGDGSSVTASGNATQTSFALSANPGSSQTASVFGATIFDILDYANTNKYKTIRSLNGVDANGSGYAWFSSGLWQSTSAITSIKIYSSASVNLIQYSKFALYGIKEAI